MKRTFLYFSALLGAWLGVGVLFLSWPAHLVAHLSSSFSPLIAATMEGSDFGIGLTPQGWPVPREVARISSEFGKRRHPLYHVVTQHNGLDFAVPEKTLVRCTAEGVVAFAGHVLHYGEMVKVWHPGDFHTIYAHNSRLCVQTGNRVRRGDVIAFSGNTGLSTGPHLHYEVRQRGVPQNPRVYLD